MNLLMLKIVLMLLMLLMLNVMLIVDWLCDLMFDDL